MKHLFIATILILCFARVGWGDSLKAESSASVLLRELKKHELPVELMNDQYGNVYDINKSFPRKTMRRLDLLEAEISVLKEQMAELRKERSYTVKEIDELREVCRLRWNYGSTNRDRMGRGRSTIMGSGEEDIGVEQLVRTYMLGGITAEDIYKEDGRSH